MSRKEIVLLASRAFAFYLTAWGISDVTYLPERFLALFHHMSQQSVLAPQNYLRNYYLLLTGFTVVRIVGLFFAASLFWKCGPRIEALFSSKQDNPPTEYPSSPINP